MRLGLALSLLLACVASQPEPRTSVDIDRCASLNLKRPTAPGEPDADLDCVPDFIDRCIEAPEDHDYFEPDDGCPDPDNDRDGVLDLADRCPDETGVAKNDGCPVK